MLKQEKREYILFYKSEKNFELKYLLRKKKKEKKNHVFDILCNTLVTF